MNRRGFLRVAAGAVAGAAGLSLLGCDVGAADDHGVDEARERRLRYARAMRRARRYVDDETAVLFGEGYLAEVAQREGGAAPLEYIDALVDELAALGSDDDAVAWIEASIADDFLVDRLMVLNGWVMSETELQICALLVLGG